MEHLAVKLREQQVNWSEKLESQIGLTIQRGVVESGVKIANEEIFNTVKGEMVEQIKGEMVKMIRGDVALALEKRLYSMIKRIIEEARPSTESVIEGAKEDSSAIKLEVQKLMKRLGYIEGAKEDSSTTSLEIQQLMKRIGYIIEQREVVATMAHDVAEVKKHHQTE